MAAAPAGNQPHLSGRWRVLARDVDGVFADGDQSGVRQAKALDSFLDNGLWIVDEFLHGGAPGCAPEGCVLNPTTVFAGGGRFLPPRFPLWQHGRTVQDAAKGQPPMTVPFLRPHNRPPEVYPSIRV